MSHDLLSFSFFSSAGKEIISHKDRDEPRFMTESGKYQFVAGSSILLPCEVSHPGGCIHFKYSLVQAAIQRTLSVP